MKTGKGKSPSTREMERITWLEFREWVPAKINTVLLPLGTLEPHGVAPNGTDILAPLAMARDIAPRVNAMIAPVISYGFTGMMDAYPGSFTVPEEIFRSYVRAVLVGLAKNKFKNVILLNGHGGGQTAILTALAQEVGRDTGTRLLVVNWWSYCSDVTLEVFGEDGGHGAENETAYVMAIDSALVRSQDYKQEMAMPLPPPNTWSAYPFPSTVMLYKEGQGQPTFDLAKAKQYFTKVNDKIARLIQETIEKWDTAGV
ncbi:MAG TPA: creatininase family protein [Candidatus Udaeobacter sp.]|jgi:creatinine amidohydrolase|nr:creatininase family protein [Candidatus Udaeobacter sp.]